MSEASSGLLCVVIKCGFHSFQTSGVWYITEKRKQRHSFGLINSDVYRLKVNGTLTIYYFACNCILNIEILVLIKFQVHTFFYIITQHLSIKLFIGRYKILICYN